MPLVGVGAGTAAGTCFISDHGAILSTLPAYYSTPHRLL